MTEGRHTPKQPYEFRARIPTAISADDPLPSKIVARSARLSGLPRYAGHSVALIFASGRCSRPRHDVETTFTLRPHPKACSCPPKNYSSMGHC